MMNGMKDKTTKILFAATMLTLVPQIGAAIPLDDVFRTFHTQMGVTNVSQGAFLTLLASDADSWINYYAADRDGVSPQELNAWYLSLASSSGSELMTNC
jgi:hypothetical protein